MVLSKFAFAWTSRLHGLRVAESAILTIPGYNGFPFWKSALLYY